MFFDDSYSHGALVLIVFTTFYCILQIRSWEMSWVMLISVPPLYHIPIQTVDMCIWLYTVSMLGSVECIRVVGSICLPHYLKTMHWKCLSWDSDDVTTLVTCVHTGTPGSQFLHLLQKLWELCLTNILSAHSHFWACLVVSN